MESSILIGLPPDIQPVPHPTANFIEPLENYELIGRSCQVLLGVRYHFDLGSWNLKEPPRWNNPSMEVARAELWPNDPREPQRTAVIRASDIAPQPPVNDTKDVVALLAAPRLPTGTHRIRLSFYITSFGLPGIGGPPLIMYVAASVQIFVDRISSFRKTYVSPGGDQSPSDEISLISSDGK